ncbi:MAG: hypothetical protein ABIY50_07465 [Ignavibacteria bacterium]
MYKKLICFSFILTLIFTVKARSQDEDAMMPPPAVFNEVYDAMDGNWTSESSMRGIPMKMDLKVYWDLNHQFLVLDLRSVGREDASMTYQGKGLFGVDEKGNPKTWWFDSWGANSVSLGSGVFNDNKLIVTGGNAMVNETRSFLVSGNEMVMNGKGTVNVDGRIIPFDETIIFRK